MGQLRLGGGPTSTGSTRGGGARKLGSGRDFPTGPDPWQIPSLEIPTRSQDSVLSPPDPKVLNHPREPHEPHRTEPADLFLQAAGRVPLCRHETAHHREDLLRVQLCHAHEKLIGMLSTDAHWVEYICREVFQIVRNYDGTPTCLRRSNYVEITRIGKTKSRRISRIRVHRRVREGRRYLGEIPIRPLPLPVHALERPLRLAEHRPRPAWLDEPFLSKREKYVGRPR